MRNPFRSRLKERVKSLEEAIGFKYITSGDWPEHIVEADGYTWINKLENKLKALEDGKRKR